MELNPICQIKLSPLTEADIEAVFEIYRQCQEFLALGPQPEASREMVLRAVQDSDSKHGVYYGIYLLSSDMVGVLDMLPLEIENQVDSVNLNLLMITPQYRRQGIGTQVLRVIESEVYKKTGISQFTTSVQVNNPDARRFWEKNGYSAFSEPELQPDSTKVVHLKKALKI